jgi:transcriptional regulator with XRE-family HTH domain
VSNVSEQPGGEIPEWTLGDRLRKAREHAGLKQSELAEMIGIARSSVVSYESDRTVPSRPVVLSWSMATGVPTEWVLGWLPAVTGRGVTSTSRSTAPYLRLVA